MSSFSDNRALCFCHSGASYTEVDSYTFSILGLHGLKCSNIGFLGDGTGSTATKILAAKQLAPSASPAKISGSPAKSSASPAKKKTQAKESLLPWTEKYRPKAIVDIIGNKSLVFFYVAFFL